MNHQITDHVAGVSGAAIARAVEEAEKGYELGEFPPEPNPHSQGNLIPADLMEAIDARAERDGQSRAEIVRRALSRYLAS